MSTYYINPNENKKQTQRYDPREAKYEKYGDREELEANIERDAILML